MRTLGPAPAGAGEAPPAPPRRSSRRAAAAPQRHSGRRSSTWGGLGSVGGLTAARKASLPSGRAGRPRLGSRAGPVTPRPRLPPSGGSRAVSLGAGRETAERKEVPPGVLSRDRRRAACAAGVRLVTGCRVSEGSGVGVGAGVGVVLGPSRTCEWRRVPWACSWALRPRLRSLPRPAALGRGSWAGDKGWRGWDAKCYQRPARRGKPLRASCGLRGVWQPSFLAGAWLSESRQEFEAAHRVGESNFLSRPLGPVMASAGPWCPGLVWQMSPAQEVKITCRPLGSIEPGSY